MNFEAISIKYYIYAYIYINMYIYIYISIQTQLTKINQKTKLIDKDLFFSKREKQKKQIHT